jgi:hypothetical protein
MRPQMKTPVHDCGPMPQVTSEVTPVCAKHHDRSTTLPRGGLHSRTVFMIQSCIPMAIDRLVVVTEPTVPLGRRLRGPRSSACIPLAVPSSPSADGTATTTYERLQPRSGWFASNGCGTPLRNLEETSRSRSRCARPGTPWRTRGRGSRVSTRPQGLLWRKHIAWQDRCSPGSTRSHLWHSRSWDRATAAR